MATSLWSMVLAIIVTFVGTIAALCLKLGADKFSISPVKLIRNYKLLLGFLLYGISSLLFILALKGGELSVLYPLLSVGYIWISLASVKFLKEKMTAIKWAGILLIIGGVSMIGLS